MSRATAAFADAMSACSVFVSSYSLGSSKCSLYCNSLKGPNYEGGTRLQAASGLHHLMGNHWHLMVCPEDAVGCTFKTYHNIPSSRRLWTNSLKNLSDNILKLTEMWSM